MSLGRTYEEGRPDVKPDSEKALKYYKISADENNHPQGCYALGFHYEHGTLGLPKDDAEAVRYYKKAIGLSVGGSPEALNAMALRHEEGRGVDKNEAFAIKLYARARNANRLQILANQGKPLAQYYLATSYLNGRGLTIDGPQAHEWFRKAAAGGVPEAIKFCQENGL